MADQLPVPVMSDADRRALVEARRLLEHPGLAARIADLVGAPIESLLTKHLPAPVTKRIDAISRLALQGAMKSALLTMRRRPHRPAARRLHALAVTATGGVGGFFGLAGLTVELPVTTTLMLRSIADIARSQGERPEDPDTIAACLSVLAHGSHDRGDDAAESGYFAVRAAMAQQVAAAAQFVATHGLSHKGAPMLVAMLSRIASRFSVSVGNKVAAQAVPVIGALGGAALNALFISHFQSVARGHFTIRRLERRYGEADVRLAWERLPADG